MAAVPPAVAGAARLCGGECAARRRVLSARRLGGTEGARQPAGGASRRSRGGDAVALDAATPALADARLRDRRRRGNRRAAFFRGLGEGRVAGGAGGAARRA